MPWKVTDVSEQRVKFVVRASAGKEAISGLCLEFGITRPTGYRWLRRYREAGTMRGLEERSRRPLRSPKRTPSQIEERVVELRQRFGWGARKLQAMLKQQGQTLPAITINRILSRHGLIAEDQAHAPATKRFQRSAPNELWQMDGKGEYRLRDGICYPLTILDDCSRYLVSLTALPAFDTERVQASVVQAFETHGLPDAMLMDHGTVWWATSNGYGLTTLSVGLIKQGIRLIYGRIGHPQTQGKVERFHRTLKEAVRHRGTPQYLRYWPALLAEIREEYNQVRPHEAIEMQTPAQRYRPSQREYRAEPKEWEYATGSLVSRLNSQGCLEWEGRRWFVCEALSGERVRVEALEQTLLVSYRHMYVREIDLEKGRTGPLVFAREGE